MIVDGPLTVSGIARRMGLTRQSVQRTANCLVRDSFAQAAANPDHQTAKLYRLTPMGQGVMAEVGRRQEAWAQRLSHGLAAQSLEDAGQLLQTLCSRLENELFVKELRP
jgi:DNA-binding MarR family transcriptional regulator